MKAEFRCFPSGFRRMLRATMVFAMVASCTEGLSSNGLDAPGIDAKGQAEDNIEVGNRLMAAGEYELALETFTRAALEQGMTPQVLTSLGTANVGLRRLGQAEKLLRRAVEDDTDWPVALEQSRCPADGKTGIPRGSASVSAGLCAGQWRK